VLAEGGVSRSDSRSDIEARAERDRRSRSRYGALVGFNPFRAHANRSTDLIVVAVAFVVIVALVLWAVFG
jgi:hypothetical protein